MAESFVNPQNVLTMSTLLADLIDLVGGSLMSGNVMVFREWCTPERLVTTRLNLVVWC
jgi:hypothetical protein